MKKMQLLLICFLFTWISLALAGPKEDADKAIADAETTNSKAGKVGFQWRDAEKIIKSAKKAAATKDYTNAIKLAKEAQDQGELAYKQYEKEFASKKY